jgi:hypothetical protein
MELGPGPGPLSSTFRADFFGVLEMRAMPRNADVMVLCDELERRVVTPVVTPTEVVTSNQPCNQRNQPKRDRAAYMRSYRAARREEGPGMNPQLGVISAVTGAGGRGRLGGASAHAAPAHVGGEGG